MYLIVLAKRMLINANYALCDTKFKIIYRASFLVKCNCRWSIKKYFWNDAWRSWRFPNFPNDSNMYKIIQLCFYDRHKTEYKSLAMKLRSWIKSFLFYQIRKVYPPRKIKFFNARAKCFYSLVAGWCSVQKTVTVFSEKYLKFFTINLLCTQVHSQCIWCSAQIFNSFKTEICSNKRIIICGWNKQPNQLPTKSINTLANDETKFFHLQFPSIWNTSNGPFVSYVLLFLVFFLRIDTPSRPILKSLFLTCSVEIFTPCFKDMISVICR